MVRKRDKLASTLSKLKQGLDFRRPKHPNDPVDSNNVQPSQKHEAATNPNMSLDKSDDSDIAPASLSEMPGAETIVPANHPPKPKPKPPSDLKLNDTAIRELWNVAYEKLREEDGALIAEYEDKLQGDVMAGLSLTLGSNASMRERMQAIVKHKMDEVNKNIWKLKVGSSEVPVRDLVQPVLGVVNLANEYITGAVSANPYASVAWVGIGVLLPLFINPSSQNASLAKGLEYISSLIAQSRMREELYIRRYESSPSGHESFHQSHLEYKDALERLYRHILRFQATSYCYYAKNSAFRLGLDVVKWNDWDELVNKVREREHEFAAVNEIWRDIQYQEECSAADNRHQETLNSWFAIGADISGLRKAVEDAQKEKSRIELLQWLCDIDPSGMYNSARDKHETGTSEWLVKDSEEFKAWEVTSGSLLWLHGKAGSGKSILSSSVIKHLQDQYAPNASTALAYFYFSFSDIAKQKVDGMLTSLIKQICSRRPDMPEPVKSLGEYKVKGARPDTEILEAALIASVRGFSAVHVVIDALDECPILGEERKKLLKSLRRIFAEAPDNLHVFCTSRKEPDINTAIRALLCPPSKAGFDLSDHREILDHDIGRYIDSTLETDDYSSWPESAKAKAREQLVKKADGMFQYVRCQFEALRDLSSMAEIDKALENLPIGLDATYDRIFQNIDRNFQPQVINSLKWLAFSVKVLTINQLAEIFILCPERDIAFNETERLFSPMDVLKYFSGLTVTQANGPGSEVRLAHFSIKEYLTSSRIAQSPALAFSFSEVDAHLYIAHSCLAYQRSISAVEEWDELPLSKYTWYNWALHLEMILYESWTTEVTQSIALNLEINSQTMSNLTHTLEGSRNMLLRPHCYAAQQGFVQLTKMLLSQEYQTQEDLDTALQYAAIGGEMKVVQLLLDMGADVNFEGTLHEAALARHTAIVELLLDKGAEINAQWGNCNSALQVAARHNRLDVVKLLVSRGANINCPCLVACMQSSLHRLAARQCLRFLLNSGADVNMQAGDSGTALHVAAGLPNIFYNGKNEHFDLLLDRGASVNELGGEFGYPLHAACQSLQFDRVKRLLDLGADPNAQGGRYGTALQAVCANLEYTHEFRVAVETPAQIVKLLIDSGAKVNITGGEWGTALQAACSIDDVNCMPIVQLLLERGADVNAQGGYYGNALQAASHRSPFGDGVHIVRLLLEHGADVNATGGQYGTALQAACLYSGNKEVVRLLIDNSAKIDAEAGQYGTALQAACVNGNIEVVRLLIDNGAKIDTEAGQYGTALQAACASGNIEVVRLLINHGAKIDAEAGHYGTALQAACVNGNIEVVRLLIDNGAKIDTEAGQYGTALQAACARGKIEVVRLLLAHGANVHLQDDGAWHEAARSSDGNALLELLLNHGVDINHVREPRAMHGTVLNASLDREFDPYGKHWDITGRVRLLLERGVDVNLAVGKYGFALQTACAIEQRPRLEWDSKINDTGASLTKLLLERCPDININAQGGMLGSALQAAAYSGQIESIRRLLDRGAHVNARGGKYGSALNAAIIRGFWHIAKVLFDAGAEPDCHQLREPDEEWLLRVREEHGRGAVERYRKVWEVEKAKRVEVVG